MKYRASVITSIYRSSEFLFDFLIDVKRQTIFNQCEFLLLDCNEDDYDLDFKIIKNFLDFKNFKYYKLDKCNVYEAWNKGIELSSSDILTNWNTDDRRDFNSLEKQIVFLEENLEYDVCYGPTLISEIPNEIFEFCKSRVCFEALDGTVENQLKHNSPHCLPVWRKSIHDRFGLFDTKYFSAADYDMWFRVLRNGGKMKALKDVVGLYYRNPIGISSGEKTFSKALEEVIEIRKKYS
jgi:hypothetical protein